MKQSSAGYSPDKTGVGARRAHRQRPSFNPGTDFQGAVGRARGRCQIGVYPKALFHDRVAGRCPPSRKSCWYSSAW